MGNRPTCCQLLATVRKGCRSDQHSDLVIRNSRLAGLGRLCVSFKELCLCTDIPHLARVVGAPFIGDRNKQAQIPRYSSVAHTFAVVQRRQ